MTTPEANPPAVAYDQLAPVWDTKYTDLRAHAENRYVFGRLVREGYTRGRVLDLGCGTGLLLDHALIPPARFVGMDVSAGMLVRALEKHPKHAFICASMEDIPLPDCSVDHVVSTFASFSYPPNPDRVAREIRRVLRPGGRFFVMPYGLGAEGWYHVEADGKPVPRHYYSKVRLLEIFQAFEGVRVQGLTFAADRILPRGGPQLLGDLVINFEANTIGRWSPADCFFMMVTGRRK